MRINGNRLAVVITKREGKKISLPIGQVKEVLRLVRKELRASHRPSEILDWLGW